MPEPIDRLSALLERFRVRVRLLHAGTLCGVSHFDASHGRGFLHVLRRGEMAVTHHARDGVPRTIEVAEPSLLFYPRPLSHTFHNEPQEGADFVCATVDFDGGMHHPLVRALPPLIVLPLAVVDGLEHTLALLFAEAGTVRCGSRILADRMFEVLMLQILRWLLDHPEQADIPRGLLTGLAHPKIAAALTAMHERPAHDWSLASMAEVAGMSRSAFAAGFKEHAGETPAEYLSKWRMSIAQTMLRRGKSVSLTADELGYGSAAAFSRAFTQVVGQSPRAWLTASATP